MFGIIEPIWAWSFCFIINYWFNFFDLGLFSLSISSILKNSFVGYRIFEWQPFSFSTLNISTHCLLASSDEKWAVNLIEELFLSCCSQESLYRCLLTIWLWFLQVFFLPLSSLTFWDSHYVSVSMLIISHSSLRLCSFSFFSLIFLSVPLSG